MKRSLEEKLLLVAEETVVGEIMRPALVHRLRTQLRATLLRHGLSKAQIQIERLGSGFQVAIFLPPAGPRVQQIRFSIGTL